MTDLIVVGAGIAGAAAAFEAACAGARVSVVDANLPGRATSAGAGIVSPIGLDRGETRGPWVELIAACVSDYQALTERIDAAVGDTATASPTYARHGEIVVARSDEERLKLQELEEWINTVPDREGHLTATAERVDASSLVECFTWLRDDLEGLFIPQVGRVDGNRFAAALLEAAQRVSPETVRVRKEHARLAVTNGRASVLVGDEVLDAGAILLATGAWMSEWKSELGYTIDVHAYAGEISHLRPQNGETSTLPVVNTFDGSYLVPFDDRIVVGATHTRRDDFDGHLSAGGQHEILSNALNIAPGLVTATLLETRVGLRPTSTDGFPLVGSTAVENVSIVSGLGSWELTLGPTLGAACARAALGEPLDKRFEFLSPLRQSITQEH